MSAQEKFYTVDDLWVLSAQPRFEGYTLELQAGDLVMHPVGHEHGMTTIAIASRLYIFAQTHDLGVVSTEVGHYVEERTVYSPDVAFTTKARQPDKSVKGYVNQMPDLAVEVKSPSNTFDELTDKAKYYLQHGARMVWLVYPRTKTVEVVTPSDDSDAPDIKKFSLQDILDGGGLLPGFTLPVKDIFP